MGQHSRRIGGLALAALFALSAAQPVARAQGMNAFGDINGSNSVDALDLQLLINVILGAPRVPGDDLNGDNSVNALDLQLMINIILSFPTLQRLDPAAAIAGAPIAILGASFGTNPGDLVVTIGGSAATITTLTNSRIDTSVPAGAQSGVVTVRKSFQTQNSNALPFTLLVGVNVEGAVMAGPVQNAAVDIFSVNAQSGALTLVGTVMTDATGRFNFLAPQPGTYLAIARGGSYTDEATGLTRSLASPMTPPANIMDLRSGTLEVLLDSGASSTVSANVTPLTNIASRRAIAASQGSGMALDPSMINASALNVARELGLVDANGAPLDPRDIDPIDLTDPSNANADPNSPEARYGALLGGISQAAQNAGLSEPLDLVDALTSDFADGLFDGMTMNAQGQSMNVMLGANPLSPTAATAELRDGLQDFLNSPNNSSTSDASSFNNLLSQVSTRDLAPAGVNVPPSFQLGNATIPRSLQAQVLEMTLRAVSAGTSAEDAAGQALSLTVQSSSNENLVRLADIHILPGAFSSERRLRFTLQPGLLGSTSITILGTDSGTPSQSLQRSFVLNVINAPPVLDLNGPANPGNDKRLALFTSNALVPLLDSQAELADPDGSTLSSLSVSFSIQNAGAETLSADVSSTSLSASFNSTQGRLDITGTASLATYSTVLRSLRYRNTAPIPSGSSRRFTVTANDGAGAGSGSAFIDLNYASISIESGDAQQGFPGQNLPAPLVLRLRDGLGAPIANSPVTLSTSAGSFGGQATVSIQSDANGRASATLTLPANPSSVTITAAANGFANSPLSLSASALAAPTAAKSAGDAQSGAPLQTLPTPLEVTLTNGSGAPASGVTVTFSVGSGGGSLDGGAQSLNRTTNAQGRASVNWTLGALGLNQIVQASASGFAGSPLSFTARSVLNPSLSLLRGNNQMGQAGADLLSPFVVTLRDELGQLAAGQLVSFTVLSGGGSFSGSNSSSVLTNSAGQAQALATLGSSVGAQSFVVSAPGFSPATLNLTATARVAPRMTRLGAEARAGRVGEMLAAPLEVTLVNETGMPASGVTVTFTVASGDALFAGNSSLQVQTNAQGRASATPGLGANPGVSLVLASAAGFEDSPQRFTLTATADPTITIISGNNQTALVNAILAQELVVQLRDASGAAATGVSVTFAVSSGNASFVPSGQSVSVDSDAQGRASIQLRADGAGPIQVSASATGFTGSPLTFDLLAQLPTQISSLTPNAQSARLGSPFPEPLRALVTGPDGLPAAGFPVTFASTGASFSNGQGSQLVSTNANGIAEIIATPTSLGAITMTATANTNLGSPLTYSGTGLLATRFGSGGPALNNSDLTVAVYDAISGEPHRNATVFLTDPVSNAPSQVLTTSSQGIAIFPALTGPQIVTVLATNAQSPDPVTVFDVNASFLALTIDDPQLPGGTVSGAVQGATASGGFVATDFDDRDDSSFPSYSLRADAGFDFRIAALSTDSSGLAVNGVSAIVPAVAANEQRAFDLTLPTVSPIQPLSFNLDLSAPFSSAAAAGFEEIRSTFAGRFARVESGAGAGSPPGGGLSRNLNAGFLPISGAQRLIVQAFAFEQLGNGSMDFVAVRGASPTNPAPFSATTRTPPSISAPSSGASGLGIRPLVSFSGANGLFIAAEASQFGNNSDRDWQLFMPNSRTSFRIPELPASFAARDFSLSDFIRVRVGAISATAPGFQFNAFDFEVFENGALDYDDAAFSVTYQPLQPGDISILNGNNQIATAGQALPIPLTVLLRDSQSAPFPGANLTFSIEGNVGAFSVQGSPTTQALSLQSAANGQASVDFIPGPGLNVIRVAAPNFNNSPVFFSVTGSGALALTAIAGLQPNTIPAGNSQNLRFALRDAAGLAISNAPITATVSAGDGLLPGDLRQFTANSDGNGELAFAFRPAFGLNILTITAAGAPPLNIALFGSGQAAIIPEQTRISLPSGNSFTLSAQATGMSGNVLAGASVTARVIGGQGSVAQGPFTTGQDGRVAIQVTAQSGLTLIGLSIPGSTEAVFELIGATGQPFLAVRSGGQQLAASGQLAALPLIVSLFDSNGLPQSGVSLALDVAAGDGSFDGPLLLNPVTDHEGRVQTPIRLGAGANLFRASVLPSGPSIVARGFGTGAPTLVLASIGGQLANDLRDNRGRYRVLGNQPLTFGFIATNALGAPLANTDFFLEQVAGTQLFSTSLRTDAAGEALSASSLVPQGTQGYLISGAGSSQAFTLVGTGQNTLTPSNSLTTISATIPRVLEIALTDAQGDPIVGATINYLVQSGAAQFSGSTMATATTDIDGRASALADPMGGLSSIAISSAQAPQSLILTLDGTGPSVIAELGQNQRAAAGQIVELRVRVRDGSGVSLPGVPVEVSKIFGLGQLSTNTVSTDALGRASVFLTLAPGEQSTLFNLPSLGRSVVFTNVGTGQPAIVFTQGPGLIYPGGDISTNSLVLNPLAFGIIVTDAQGDRVPNSPINASNRGGTEGRFPANLFGPGNPPGDTSFVQGMTDSQGQLNFAYKVGFGLHIIRVESQQFSNTAAEFSFTGSGAARLKTVSGNEQVVLAPGATPVPWVLRLTNANGFPVNGETLSANIDFGPAQLSSSNPTTNAQGEVSLSVSFPSVGASLIFVNSPNFNAGEGGRFVGIDGINSGLYANTSINTDYNPNFNSSVFLGVTLLDASGQEISGETVTFSVLSGQADLNMPGGGASFQQTQNFGGRFGIQAFPISSAGQIVIQASNPTAQTGSPVTFTIRIVDGNFAQSFGDGQHQVAGQALPAPFVVTIQDFNQQPIVGRSVNFQVTNGIGSFGGNAMTSAVTDSQGRATATLTVGDGQSQVTATAPGVQGQVFFSGFGAPSTSTLQGRFAAGGGTIVDRMLVKVVETDGSPFRGALVFLGDGSVAANLGLIATSNAAGEVLFTGLPSNTPQTLTVFIEPQSGGRSATTIFDVNAAAVTVRVRRESQPTFANLNLTVNGATNSNNVLVGQRNENVFFPFGGQGPIFLGARPGKEFFAVPFEVVDQNNDDYTPLRGSFINLPALLPGESQNISTTLGTAPLKTLAPGQISFSAPFTSNAFISVEDGSILLTQRNGEFLGIALGGGSGAQAGASPGSVGLTYVDVPSLLSGTKMLRVAVGISEDLPSGEIFAQVSRAVPDTLTQIPNMTMPTPPTLITPFSGATGISVRPQIGLTAPGGAQALVASFFQFAFVGGQFFFNDWFVITPPGKTSFALPGLPPGSNEVFFDDQLIEADLEVLFSSSSLATIASNAFTGFNLTGVVEGTLDFETSGVFIEFEPSGLATGPRILSGNNQRGLVSSALQPLEIQVLDQNGLPLANSSVTFTRLTGSGLFSNGQSSITLTTDASGFASAIYTLGATPDASEMIQVTAPGAPGAAVFQLTALANAPLAGVFATGGGPITGGLSVTVTVRNEASLEAMAGVTVFASDATGALLQTQTTNASGQATLNGLTGPVTITAGLVAADGEAILESLVGVNARQINIGLREIRVLPARLALEITGAAQNMIGSITVNGEYDSPGSYPNASFELSPGAPTAAVALSQPNAIFGPLNIGQSASSAPTEASFLLLGALRDRESLRAQLPMSSTGIVSFNNSTSMTINSTNFPGGAPIIAGIDFINASLPKVRGSLLIGGGDISNSQSLTRMVSGAYFSQPSFNEVVVEYVARAGQLGGPVFFANTRRRLSPGATTLPATVSVPGAATITSPAFGSTGLGARPVISFSSPLSAQIKGLEFEQQRGNSSLRWNLILPGTATSGQLPILPGALATAALQIGQPVDVGVYVLRNPNLGSFDFDSANFEATFDESNDREESGTFAPAALTP